MADVKSNLKQIIDQRGVTIRQLADDSGLKFETVRRLYHDKTVQYHRKSIAHICDALNVDVSDLLSLDHSDNQSK